MKTTANKTTITDVKVLFERPQGEKLLVGKIIDINGSKYLDIRSHYISEDGTKVPTSRGIRLSWLDFQSLYVGGLFDDDFYSEVTDLLLKGGVATERS